MAVTTGRHRTPRATWAVLIAVPTLAWMTHLVALSSLVRLACAERPPSLAMHGVTAVALLAMAAPLRLAWRLRGEEPQPEGPAAEPVEAGAARRHAFIGTIGLGVVAFNVALVGLEELYVVVFHGHACG